MSDHVGLYSSCQLFNQCGLCIKVESKHDDHDDLLIQTIYVFKHNDIWMKMLP